MNIFDIDRRSNTATDLFFSCSLISLFMFAGCLAL